ncbi:hypothetical protein B0H11DRAFT_2435705 [Mycena galericulata]|nr:hypothetical protein B0H11DRAFT_2324780 [Mycena galericulata]KAJ7469274.1 hypothetical protein B0H11DRAFT_2435705 [Mycena galericulata]
MELRLVFIITPGLINVERRTFITGDAAVGKSSLLAMRLTNQCFLANPDPTLGVEFSSKPIALLRPDATIVRLQC